jgi:hypothetical protein
MQLSGGKLRRKSPPTPQFAHRLNWIQMSDFPLVTSQGYGQSLAQTLWEKENRSCNSHDNSAFTLITHFNNPPRLRGEYVTSVLPFSQ